MIADCRLPIADLTAGTSRPAARARKPSSSNPQFLPLLLALALFAPVLAAQERTPAEAEAMYLDVGAQLRCVCGDCRDELLECSHTNCRGKLTQRAYLRELCQNAGMDPPAVRQAMVARFGDRVLQVHPQSHLYVVLGIALLVLSGAFGGMFWYVAGKRRAAAPVADAEEAIERGETELRIERDMRELP